MSLPLATPTYYRMADVSPASANIQGLLDAIYTALGASTDYRGTSLASTHLWTVARQQAAGVTKAVYLTPPSGTGMGLSPGLIIAGDSGAPTPTMASPDTFTASHVLAGIVKNRGAWNAWDAASPFTSGTFSGYWRWAGTTWNATTAVIRCYVSEEAIFIQLIGPTVTNQAWLHLGAIVEPHTTYSASSGLTAESDDRLYGMWTTGATAVQTSTWQNSNVSPGWHATSNGASHMMVFQPGGSTLYTCGRRYTSASTSSTTETQDLAGAYVGDLYAICRSSGATNGARLGMLRGLYATGQMQSGKTVRNGSTDLNHAVSTDTTAVTDAFMLKAAP